MKIVIDHKVPFIKGVFESVAEVRYIPGGEITHENLVETDCLIVRTRTRCDRELLENTRISFIGTATIGFDHIDTEWCNRNSIAWTNAPGCNSGGVAQYIRAALLELSVRKGFRLEEKTLGIIGVGHVGAKVDQLACGLGIRTLLNDPPRARKEGPSGFTDLTDLLRQSDIVTIHVPLNREGPDSTLHLVDKYFLDQIKPGAILINTSRGEVMDEKEVVECIKDGRQSGTGAGPSALVIDVWENEPDINRELLALAEIATPHIAGYSINGKYNATRMIADAVKDFFRLEIQPIPPLLPEIDGKRLKGSKPEYDISVDDRKLRESPESFEQLRNNYPERWE